MNKWQFMVLVAVSLVAGLIGGVISDRLARATGKKVIEAEAFKVVDKAGNVRVSLSADKAASALSLFDDNGEPRAIIGAIKGGPSVELYDAKGDRRAILGTTSLEDPKTGSSINRAESSLVLFNQKGKVLWSAP